MDKPYRQVDKIYGYKTMKVPEVLHKAIKERAEAHKITIIDYLSYAVELEIQDMKLFQEEFLKEVK